MLLDDGWPDHFICECGGNVFIGQRFWEFPWGELACGACIREYALEYFSPHMVVWDGDAEMRKWEAEQKRKKRERRGFK
jgi:hypothetical protein